MEIKYIAAGLFWCYGVFISIAFSKNKVLPFIIGAGAFAYGCMLLAQL